MTVRPMESPPPYRPDDFKPSYYAPSKDMYGVEVRSQPAFSYYPEDEVQHFYKWTSPPGIIKAIAIVLGFLIIVAFALIIFFAVKTRNKINDCGKSNIMWDKNVFSGEGVPNVEEWVKNVSVDPEQFPPLAEYTDRVNGSVADYSRTNGVGAYPDASYRNSPDPEVVYPLKNEFHKPSNVYSSSSDATPKKSQQKKRAGRPRRTDTAFDTDYTTGGESCEELDDDDWEREYPHITSDQQRQEYKHEFDSGLQEYKKLQADLEEIHNILAQVDRELDDLPEESEAYKVAADKYNRLKEIKASADYQNKKRRSKQLKQKLSHIKRMVSDYDNQKL
uniref:Occludin isoform X2 n=1 Tax=Geotrypetes seraphini TaxID=260995 RepID=A0A6P8QAW3_GEOSA|nr:occludin isoform X2 [Geotrypetes seraphini]